MVGCDFAGEMVEILN